MVWFGVICIGSVVCVGVSMVVVCVGFSVVCVACVVVSLWGVYVVGCEGGVEVALEWGLEWGLSAAVSSAVSAGVNSALSSAVSAACTAVLIAFWTRLCSKMWIMRMRQHLELTYETDR